jgi:hypothetical protein
VVKEQLTPDLRVKEGKSKSPALPMKHLQWLREKETRGGETRRGRRGRARRSSSAMDHAMETDCGSLTNAFFTAQVDALLSTIIKVRLRAATTKLCEVAKMVI